MYSSGMETGTDAPMSGTGGSRSRRRFADLFERLSAQREELRDGAAEGVRFRDATSGPSGELAHMAVTWPLRVAAAWSWRALLVAAASALIVWGAMKLSIIVLPVAIALLLTVLLEPLVGFFHRRAHLSQTLSAVAGLLVGFGIAGALVTQAASSLFQQFPSLLVKASGGLDKAVDWLTNGPLALDDTTVDKAVISLQDEITGYVQANSSLLASGALSVTSSLASVLAGALITLFCLFFFLKEGRRIWLWVVRLLPASAREPVHESAIRGWATLGGYVRTQIKVAAIDAAGIGLGAAVLHVPMAVPITVLVFFGSFIPIVGAFLSGTVAVLVAVVDKGLTTGLIMLLVILVVQQIEGNILQPWLMSNAVSLHPVAVLLVVTGAGAVAGIPGALFGVPIAAFLNSTFLYLHGYDPLPELRTKRDRPGGPPGMLAELVAASYAPKDAEEADSQTADASAADPAAASAEVMESTSPESGTPSPAGGSGQV